MHPTLQEVDFGHLPVHDMEGLLFGPKCYVLGEVRIIYTQEEQEDGPWHHVSVSCADRYPSWEEMKEVCRLLLPGRDVIQWVQVPDDTEWVNVMPNCFHLMSPRNGRVGRVQAPRLEDKKE